MSTTVICRGERMIVRMEAFVRSLCGHPWLSYPQRNRIQEERETHTHTLTCTLTLELSAGEPWSVPVTVRVMTSVVSLSRESSSVRSPEAMQN